MAEKTKISPFETIEAKVEHMGEVIVLPAQPQHMTYNEAIKWLGRLMAMEEEVLGIHEPIECFPFDGAVAFMKAMKRIYGWASPQPPQSFFEAPPTMVSVDVGVNQRIQIIWGKFKVPGLEAELVTRAINHEGKYIFCLAGQVKRKHMNQVHRLAELTRQIVAEESIYRGKAVELGVTEDGHLDPNISPKFIDLSRTNPSELVFSRDLMEQVQTNLFTPIEQTEICKQLGIPLKRGVLLEGPFGTGKTLCAYVTAQKCEHHGWTFLTVHRVSALKGALQFAAMYQPCVIFCEDIDREVGGDTRNVKIDDILNVVDGIVSKGREIITVLTSNEAETINRAMLRPGRLDAVLHIDAPDAEAAQRLMRIYGRGKIAEHDALAEAGEQLKGMIPAVIRECVERSKLYAIHRAKSADFMIVDADIANAARGMKRHLELLAGHKPTDKTDEHIVGEAIGRIMAKTLSDTANAGGAKLHDIHERVGEILHHVS